MSKQKTVLTSLPISWLSDGKLKLSLLIRHGLAGSSEPERTRTIFSHLTQDKAPTKHLSAILPASILTDRSVLARASDDYLRCIVAKAIAEVYRKVTPNYRNEAARKQFFKRLVEIAEAIHLSESSERLHEVLTASQSDEVMNRVSSEVQRLIAEKVDLAAEYNSKLVAARAEFRSHLKQLERITGVTWQESERFQVGLSVASFFPPGVHESEDTWQWGSQWHPEIGVLNINPPVTFIDVFRNGVLAREAAALLAPRILDTMERGPRVLAEQSEYLAYKLFERSNDKLLWSEARHGLRQQTRFRGHELIDFFQYYEMLVGDSLYREVWSRLKEFGGARLTFSDYLIILNSLAARPTNPKFDDDELELLRLLSKKPNVAVGEAARQLRKSIPTTMKAIKDISRKAGLLFTIVVDLEKIGLVENLALINTSKQAELVRVLSRFPYCRQVFRTYGSFDLFVVIDVPEEQPQFTRQFLERMVERKLISRYSLLRLQRDFQAVNFDSYSTELGRWAVHWDTWGLSLRESLSKPESFGLDYSSQARRFQFDKLDLNILSMLQVDCRASFSGIGRYSSVSGAYVGKKVARMLRENVFRHAIWPLKIGAEDWGLVALSCPKQVASVLAQYLSWLPAWRGGLVDGDFEGLLAIVWSPSGELKQLFKAIDDRLVRNGNAQAQCLNPIGEWLMSRWLPVDPGDPWQLCTDEGKWLFDERKYLALIE